jgi:hypothetical protein
MLRFTGRLAGGILNTLWIMWEFLCIVGGCIVIAFCLSYDFLRVCLTGRFYSCYMRPIVSALRVSWHGSSTRRQGFLLLDGLWYLFWEQRRLMLSLVEMLLGCLWVFRSRRSALYSLLLLSLGTAWLWYFMPQPGHLAEAGALGRAVFRADNYALIVMMFVLVARR